MAVTDKDDLISIIEEDDDDIEIPEEMPLMPVRDVVIFTDMLLPLFVGRDKSIKAVEDAMSSSRHIFLATQKDPITENPKPEEIYTVGTVGKILRMIKLPDGRIKALVQGVAKGSILEYVKKKPCFHVKLSMFEDDPCGELSLENQAMMRNVRENSEKILTLKGEVSSEITTILDSIEEPGRLADLVASNLKLKIEEAQELLELKDQLERLKKVNDLLGRELELTVVQAKIQSDVRDEISKTQRDYYLREQVRAINKELGEFDERALEAEEYKKKIKKAKMSTAAKEESERQLRRLEQMHPDSSEAAIVRSYLDWLVELPWSKATKDSIDIKEVKAELDKDHFGLDKVKERILEYLSVRKLNPKMKGPILCFVGPPGVGKTSLGRSIANSMKRKFIRISLGGVRDEAEIRGHRRTYIGALPGRILQGLKQCEVNNPVFMMDEIDKLGSDFRGDPSSALLEALDPEQNSEFSDHYVNLPFDLSNVMFIMTANMTDTIPSALLDRMEVIEIAGYTHEEKEKIAFKYLLPRQIKENGLKKEHLKLSSSAMALIISEYTAEAGVRNLEREIGSICRKIARKIAEGKDGNFIVNVNNLSKYLGIPKYQPEMEQEQSQVGLSTGLAWTQIGGEVLYIEASLLPGKGEMIITGQIGEVMQESARAAFTYAKANLGRFGMKETFLDNQDVHIHIPAGAIPKDGPSAGTAMAAALISVITGKPIKKDVAMSGEITLRGRVLPVGGLKEKSLGALRAGIKTIIVPEKNKKDLTEIPPNVHKAIRFLPVSQMEEVLKEAIDGDVFEIKPKKQSKKPQKPKVNKAPGSSDIKKEDDQKAE